MDETSAAYLAGIIDGEGHVAIAKRRPNKRSGEKSPGYLNTLRVGSTDPRLLEWILAKTKCGSIHQEKLRPNCKPFYIWGVSSIEAERVLRIVYPYLVIKKEQAELVFQLRATIDYNKHCQAGTPSDVLEKRDFLWAKLGEEHNRRFVQDRHLDMP